MEIVSAQKFNFAPKSPIMAAFQRQILYLWKKIFLQAKI